MKLEEQVLSIEQSKHLIELGLDMSDAAFWWQKQYYDRNGHVLYENPWKLQSDKYELSLLTGNNVKIPTYTLQEVLDKLPTRIEEKNKGYYPYVDVFDEIVRYCSAITLSEEGTYLDTKDKSDSLLESAYNMLCWVLENKY